MISVAPADAERVVTVRKEVGQWSSGCCSTHDGHHAVAAVGRFNDVIESFQNLDVVRVLGRREGAGLPEAISSDPGMVLNTVVLRRGRRASMPSEFRTLVSQDTAS